MPPKVVVRVRPADGVTLRQVTLFADGRPLAMVTSRPIRRCGICSPDGTCLRLREPMRAGANCAVTR